jgi:hypothetical protein
MHLGLLPGYGQVQRPYLLIISLDSTQGNPTHFWTSFLQHRINQILICATTYDVHQTHPILLDYFAYISVFSTVLYSCQVSSVQHVDTVSVQ